MNIILILDESGSVSHLKQSYLDFVNGIIVNQRDKVDSSSLFTLVKFNDTVKFWHKNIPLSDVPEFTVKDYDPVNRTALYDAIGMTIAERNPDTPTFVAIITDGKENASKTYTQQDIFDMIEKFRERGNWSFCFMGANQDAYESGERLGMLKSDCVNYSNDSCSLERTTGNCNVAIGQGVAEITRTDNCYVGMKFLNDCTT